MRRIDLQRHDASLDAPFDPALDPALERRRTPGKATLVERIDLSAWGTATGDPRAALAAAEGSTGAPLPDDTRARFEASLGTDLSSVRVHTGAGSATAAQGLGARAFATGQDIHFAAGQYRVDSLFGQHLLAHEVAHTVQQRGGGADGPQAKLEVSQPGDAHELEADRAADAMVSGARASVTTGAGPRLARDVDGGDRKPPAPVWVEFTPTGTWSGPQVADTLAALVAVPDDLRAAILAGPKATASYCVELRKRVAGASADPARQAEVEQITSALTSRITELVYATSRSPLQYRQLADVARWAAEYAAAAPGGAPAAGPSDPAPEAGHDKASAPAEGFATQLASAPGGRVRDGDKDQIRTAQFQSNDDHPGEESGNPALAGWTFRRDPFDNTVTAVRPDGTGLQFTYQVDKPADGGAPRVTLIGTVELTKLRVAALKRQDKMAPIELQESAAGRDRRLANDKANGAAARQKYRDEHPGVVEAWEAEMTKWNALDKEEKKKTKPPPPPAMYPVGDPTTTACTSTPTDVYRAAGGNQTDGFPFTAPKTWSSWRTLASNPEGPRPGDVYYLWDLDKGRAAHMGVFKSATPVPGSDHHFTWVVTDGGQGGYDQIQQAQERTRGPFNKTTGIFSSSIAEAGQQKGDRRLDGWVDIDAYRAEHP